MCGGCSARPAHEALFGGGAQGAHRTLPLVHRDPGRRAPPTGAREPGRRPRPLVAPPGPRHRCLVRRPVEPATGAARRGYATEIGAAAIRLVDDVLAVDEVHNRSSRAVMERLGMSYRGEIRRPGLVEGVAGMVDDAPLALYVLARTPLSRRAE